MHLNLEGWLFFDLMTFKAREDEDRPNSISSEHIRA